MAFAATGCGADDGGAGANPLHGSRWEVTSLHDGTAIRTTHPTTIITIVFGEDSAEGYDGCNRYGVPYTVEADRIAFGDVASTGAACLSADHTAQAGRFLETLAGVTRFELSNDDLALGSDATEVLRLRRADDLLLGGISWWLTGYRAPGGGLTAPLDGAPVSLWFGLDGVIVGSAGCNSYSAGYRQSGTTVSIGEISSTGVACDAPDGVMAQEADYLALLATATSFRTDLTALELLDADGRVVAAFAFGGRTR